MRKGKGKDRDNKTRSPHFLLQELRNDKKKDRKDLLSIEMNGIELSDYAPSRKDSDLSEKLLPPKNENQQNKKVDELTIEEVIGKIFPDFIYFDEKTNKSKIKWRHVDKSALKDIFGQSGRKTLKGKNYFENLTVPSRTFLHKEPEENEEEDDDASHQLSFQKLQKYIDEQHPREDYIDANNRRRKKPFSLMISTGNYFFENEENELQKYGLGITLYFKYVKYLIILFLVLFIINLPALLIFFLNRNSFPVHKSKDLLTSFLFKTTFGNIGGEQAVCGKATYSSDDPQNQRLTFQCPENMRIVMFFGMALRNGSSCRMPRASFDYLIEDTYKENCETEILSRLNIEGQCEHQSECTLKVDVNSVPTSCRVDSDTFDPLNPVYLNGFAICEEFFINLPGMRGLEKKDIYYLFVVIDLFSVIIYTAGYFWVIKLEQQEEIQFKKNLLSPEQYTLKITGFGRIQNIWSYLNDLIEYFKENSPQIENMTIADVNFVSFDEDYMKVKYKIGFTLRKIHTLEVLLEKAKKDNLERHLIRGLLELHLYEIIDDCDKELRSYYRDLEKIELCKPMKVPKRENFPLAYLVD